MPYPTHSLGFVFAIVVAAATSFGVISCFDTAPVSVDDPYESYRKLTTTELVEKLQSEEDEDARLAAILQIATRPEDAIIIPALVKQTLSRNDLIRTTARNSLARMGKRVVPHLKPLLASGSNQDFYGACEALRSIGPLGNEFLVDIAPRLDDPSQKIRMASLFAFSHMGEHATPHLEKIIEQLDHANMNVRLWACRTLISMGKAAAPAAPKLIDLMENGLISDKGFAVMALGAIGPSKDYDVVALVSKHLDAFTQPEKERALLALANLGKLSMPAIDQVKNLLDNPSKNCVVPAALAHWKITGDATDSVEALTGILKDISIRQDAAEMLGQFGEAAAAAVPELVKQLDSDDEAFRESLVLALGSIGPSAKTALGKLNKLQSNDPDRLIRFEAQQAIKKIEGNPSN